MSESKKIEAESEAVIAHISHMQAVISRMANNSAACKTWCITLVSAIFVFIANMNKPDLIVLTAIPTFLFLFLDTYYHALERSFRGEYKLLLEKIKRQSYTLDDLYEIKRDGNLIKHFGCALFSHALYPFYLGLIALIFVIKELKLI